MGSHGSAHRNTVRFPFGLKSRYIYANRKDVHVACGAGKWDRNRKWSLIIHLGTHSNSRRKQGQRQIPAHSWVTWRILTRVDASSVTASSLLSSSPSSHSVRARTPAGTCPHCSNSRQRRPTPESRATGGHTETPATSEDREDNMVIQFVRRVLHLKTCKTSSQMHSER